MTTLITPLRSILSRPAAALWPVLWALLVAAALGLPGTARAQEMAENPGDRKVKAVFNDAKIEIVLQVLGNQADTSISAFGRAVGQRVSIFKPDATLEEALTSLATPNNLVWFKQDDGTFGIADEQWYRQNILPNKVITKIFRPDHVNAAELEQAIRPALTRDIGSITSDNRTNKIIVSDLPDVIERIERLIREIDVQLFTRVFYLRYADVEDIAQKIETYKSDPGTIEVDPKTHQIIVTDLLSNIKKMELLIDILDVGPEIVIYDVNNIGIDGEDLEQLQEIIETIRTPDLLFEINDKQGVFILEDVPEVHERVEQILAGFDRPVKQVLIQAEILQTTFNRGFNIGLQQAAISGDPFINPPDAAGTRVGPRNPVGTIDDDDDGMGFRELASTFPYLALSGNQLAGAYLGDEAFIEYQASFEDTNTKTLLQPRLLVKNQEASRIRVGSEEPFLSTITDTNNVNNFRTQTQQTVRDGLTFEVTPSISNSYLIELDLQIDNDDAQPVTRLADGEEFTLIRSDTQTLETILTIPSGQTRVIGGLITNSDAETNGGLPFLSSLPVVGPVFGSRSTTTNRTQLQIFITPTIVEDTIPRQINEDGRRGRMVTNYAENTESYAPAADEDISLEDIEAGDFDFDPSDLMSGAEGAGVAGELEQLGVTREVRQPAAGAGRDSNFRPQATGGSASIGGGGGNRGGGGEAPVRTRGGQDRPAEPGSERDREEETRRPSPTDGGGGARPSQPVLPPPSETRY
ncbi:MAG: secretin N-terminal domain-containing protein [Sumerlaeia bacterium]